MFYVETGSQNTNDYRHWPRSTELVNGWECRMAHTHTEPPSLENRRDSLIHDLHGAIFWEADASAIQFYFVSESTDSMLGYPANQWRNEAGFFRKRVHPDDWGRVLETLNRAATEGGTCSCEHRMLKVSGATLWAQTSVHRSGKSNGTIVLAGVTVDITHLKEREQALRESESVSRLLVENLRDYAVFMLSVEGVVATWTPAAQRLKGYRAEEAVGMALWRFFPPEEVEKGVPKQLLRDAELERQAEYEGWLIRQDGSRFWANLVLTAVTDEHGRLRGYSNVARDLSERKQAEQAVRQSEEHFRLLVESQEYSVFMVSPASLVESWNRGAQRLQGFRSHEIIGASFAMLFPAEDVEADLADRLLARAARTGNATYEGWLARKGEPKFWGLLSISAIEDESGRLRGFSMLARDIAERRSTEQALRRSEEHFRLLVESVQDHGVFMLSLDGIVESWNQGAQRLNGYRANEIIGSSVSRFFPAEEIESGRVERLLKDAIVNGSAVYEGALVRKDGARFWGVVTLSAVEDEGGRLRGLSNVARDVTERKKVEDALREGEERLRLLIESLKDYGVFMITPDGRVASWSSGAERLKGYAAGEAIGSPLSRFFPPEEQEKGPAERLVQRAATEGRSEYEGWIMRKGGERFWGNVIFTAILDRHGKLRGVSNVARDLTERMRAERAQSFLLSVGDALAGSLNYSETLERVVRLTTREFAHWCLIDILHDDGLRPVAMAHSDPDKEATLRKAARSIANHSKLGCGIANVVQTGRPELEALLHDGRCFVDGMGIASRDALNELGASSYLCVPLTARGTTFGAMALFAAPERRYTREDLTLAVELAHRASLAIDNARLYEQARSAIHLREEILGVVSHDLRNPLTSIQVSATLLRNRLVSDAPDKAVEDVIDRISRASDQMTALIRDLLDFSSIQAGQLRIEAANHPVRELIGEAIDNWRPLAVQMGMRIEKTVETDAVVRCDRQRILQVLSNLVGNAVKFGHEGGVVTLGARRGRDEVVFSVIDTGPGIPKQDLAKIFDRYWRGDNGQSESTGLGLAISKGIVMAHGGTIWVESDVGRGSAFYFSLPART
jgi:PAS domain S-box-containing protein